MTRVAGVMIAHDNEYKALIRLERDLLPALRLFDAELIVIDNSAAPCRLLEKAVRSSRLHGQYHWQHGENLCYGPAMNLAVKLADSPYLAYVCTNHGRSHDRSWLVDLLKPLDADEHVAMTGTLAPAGPPEQLGFDPSLPDVHVQGGVFAARTELLRAHPYPDGEFQHYGSDLYVCFALAAAGHKLVDVPSVRSVWRASAGPGRFKYVHEDADG